MKKIYTLIWLFFAISLYSGAQNPLNCNFMVAANACVNQEVYVVDTTYAPANAVYLWDFDGADVLSGTGAGPYYVRWGMTGVKHITLSITFQQYSCSATRTVVVTAWPLIFHMTGGGTLVPGSPGVNVGLSGSETGVVYKLQHDGWYTGLVIHGTGQAISFGLQTALGNYSAIANVDGPYECMAVMEGVASVTTNTRPVICMVTFDTLSGKNKILWNKYPGNHLSHFNIFKETYQNNVFDKIGEVPFANLSVFQDPTSDPLIKSDRFEISVTDSAGNESEKSPFHKTIHLNINPGISGFNLIWNHYEGFEYQTYRIHRKHATGRWETIDSVASNVDSYTDFYSASGITTYYIEVVKPEPCNPSMKSSGTLCVISNTAAAAPLGIGENERIPVSVYPNPAREKLNLLIPGNSIFQIEILRPDGVIVSGTMVSGPSAEINVSGLCNGLYLLRITGNNAVTVRKFVKN